MLLWNSLLAAHMEHVIPSMSMGDEPFRNLVHAHVAKKVILSAHDKFTVD